MVLIRQIKIKKNANKTHNALSDAGNSFLAETEMALFSSLEIKHFFRTDCHNIHIGDEDGNTPLHVAVKEGNISIIKSILQYGGSTESTNNNGETALHIAAKEKNFDTMKLLLHVGANPNTQDNHKCTPLHYFLQCLDHSQWGNLQEKQKIMLMIREILDSGAFCNIRNSNGKALIHLAVLSQQPDLVEMIMEDARIRDIKEDKLRAKYLIYGVGLFALGFLGIAKLNNRLNLSLDNLRF